jgi:hypothetical protein
MGDGRDQRDGAMRGPYQGSAAGRTTKGRAHTLFVFRFTGESDMRWRAVNARDVDEARAQALILSNGDLVDYGLVDRESGNVALLGTIGGA